MPVDLMTGFVCNAVSRLINGTDIVDATVNSVGFTDRYILCVHQDNFNTSKDFSKWMDDVYKRDRRNYPVYLLQQTLTLARNLCGYNDAVLLHTLQVGPHNPHLQPPLTFHVFDENFPHQPYMPYDVIESLGQSIKACMRTGVGKYKREMTDEEFVEWMCRVRLPRQDKPVAECQLHSLVVLTREMITYHADNEQGLARLLEIKIFELCRESYLKDCTGDAW